MQKKSSIRNESFPEVFRRYWPQHVLSEQVPGVWRCPFHSDSRPSFHVYPDHGVCYAGCKNSNGGNRFDIVDLVMLAEGLDYNSARKFLGLNNKGNVTKEYIYTDEAGHPIFKVVRYFPKDFRQFRWNPKDRKYETKLGDCRRVLYNLPAILRADEVYIVEGERDVETLVSLGFIATCNPGGAGKWSQLDEKYQITKPLLGKTVIIVPDNDEAGHKHAEDVIGNLKKNKIKCSVAKLPNEVKDVTELVEKYGQQRGREIFLEIVKNAKLASSENNKDNDGLKVFDIAIGVTASWYLFLDQYGTAHWEAEAMGQMRCAPVYSSDFCEAVSDLVFAQAQKPIGSEQLHKLQLLLSARAKREKKEETLWLRSAFLGDRIEIDLADESRDAIVITSRNVEIKKPTARFRRLRLTGSLPRPTEGNNILDLLDLIHMSEEDVSLLALWIGTAWLSTIARPILVLHGPPGSGKTTISELIQGTLDPSPAGVLALSNDPVEIMLNLDLAQVLAFDNVRKIDQNTSDLLCRAVTGAAAIRRQLYTDREPVIFHAQRALILNGIDSIGTQPDLLDRCLLVELDRIPETSRKSRIILTQEYKERMPSIIAEISRALSIAMDTDLPEDWTPITRLHDWESWAVRVGIGYGWEPEEAVELVRIAAKRIHQETTATNPIVSLILELVHRDILWQGTVNDLFSVLSRLADENGMQSRAVLPRTPLGLGRHLQSIVHILQESGIDVSRIRTSSERKWIFRRSQERRR